MSEADTLPRGHELVLRDLRSVSDDILDCRASFADGRGGYSTAVTIQIRQKLRKELLAELPPLQLLQGGLA